MHCTPPAATERDARLKARKKKKNRLRSDLHWADFDVYNLESSDSDGEPIPPLWTECTEMDYPWEDYRGDFVKGEKHGTGRWRLCDGSVYEGQIKRNKFHGFGIMTYGTRAARVGNTTS